MRNKSSRDQASGSAPPTFLCSADCTVTEWRMASIVIPGQQRRWGNESTNFFQASYAERPGVASRQKVYRCRGSQYTNAGHYHVGTKAINLGSSLDPAGLTSRGKSPVDDQRLPRALMSSEIQKRRLVSPGPSVNLYQSHQQSHQPHTMPRPTLRRSRSQDATEADSLARSLSNAFYITSYQSDIARHAAVRTRSSSQGDTTLRESLARRTSITSQTASNDPPHRYRVASAPPVSRQPPNQYKPSLVASHPPPPPLPPPGPAPGPASHQPSTNPNPVPPPQPPPYLQRRRSFSAVLRSYPSKAEMLRDIFTAFPAPDPQPPNRRQGRPSSAVTLRAGQIPNLRRPKPVPPQAWV